MRDEIERVGAAGAKALVLPAASAKAASVAGEIFIVGCGCWIFGGDSMSRKLIAIKRRKKHAVVRSSSAWKHLYLADYSTILARHYTIIVNEGMKG